MATAVHSQRQQPAPKYDAYVEGQLDRAQRRIRTLDVTTALLGFLAGTLAYGIVMALLDNAFTLPSSALHVSFFVYLAVALGYLGFTVLRPLTRQINPYFAARKVEENLPDAKNSVVNYLDLRDDERLPAPVHNAVGARAARDLAKVDIDSAVSARRAGFAGGTVGLMIFVVLVVLFAFGSRKFFSHLGRVFLPFSGGSVATRTEIELLEPDRDPLTVSTVQSVTVRVRIDGDRPDVVKLITRPSLDETAETVRFLSPEQDPDRRDQWAITLTPEDLKRGVYYRVVAGDSSTDEQRIEVQATPSIETETFRATFNARPYIAQGQERIQIRNRSLRAFNGTHVTIDAQTNRKLESAAMAFSWEEGPKDKPVRKERIVDAKVSGQHLQVPNFLMVQTGVYRLRFKSTDGEVYEEPASYPLNVIPDNPPKIELMEPGKDTALAADALLKLEGKATDDVGVQSVTLHLTADGKPLKSRPYRSEAEIRLKDGGFPRDLDYKDSVSLAKLTDAGDKPFAMRPGMVLEYWLEASDACDFPRPNVGMSKKYKVVILEKRQDPKQAEAEEKKAEQERQEHQKKQDEKIAQENRNREKEREQQAENNRQAQQQPDPGTKPKNDTPPDKPKEGNGEKQPGANPDDKQLKDKHDRLENAAQNHERGTGKPDKPEPQDTKPGEKNQTGKGKPDQKQAGQPDPKPDQAKQGETGMQEKPGASKDQGQPMPQNQQAAGEKDKPPQKQPAQAKGNPQPKPDQKQDDRASAKPQQGQPDPNCAKCKENGGGKPGENQGAGKTAGAMKPDEQTAQSKDAGGMGGQPQAAQAKQGGQPQGGQQEPDRAQSKDAGQNATAQAAPKPASKDMAGGTGAAADKAAAPKEQPAAAAKDGAIGDNRTAASAPQKPPEEARTPDVQQMAKGLQDPDPAKRAEARKQLEQVADKAVDGAARDAARNELDKTKKPPTGTGAQQPASESKEDKTGSAGATSAGKEGPKNDMAGAQAKAKGGPGDEQKKDQASAKAATKDQADAHKFEQLADDLQKKKEKNDAAGQQATKEEIDKTFKQLMDALRSDDPQRQEDARKALEQIAKAAKDDKKTRDATPEKTVKETVDELLRDAQSDDPKKSEAARRALKEMQEFAKQNQTARDAIPPEQQKKMDEIAKQEQAKKNGGDAGTGGTADQGPAKPTKPTPTAGDPAHRQQAGSLLLDKFNDKVKKQVLKEADVSDADLEAIRKWKERTANTGSDGDPLKPVGKALQPTGIERVGGVDPAGKIDGSSDGLPPVEYRGAYQRFTERQSKSQTTPGNK